MAKKEQKLSEIGWTCNWGLCGTITNVYGIP